MPEQYDTVVEEADTVVVVVEMDDVVTGVVPVGVLDREVVEMLTMVLVEMLTAGLVEVLTAGLVELLTPGLVVDCALEDAADVAGEVVRDDREVGDEDGDATGEELEITLDVVAELDCCRIVAELVVTGELDCCRFVAELVVARELAAVVPTLEAVVRMVLIDEAAA